MSKLNARAARIKAAGIALYGERGQSKMAATIGISKQMLSFVVTGERAVTDDVAGPHRGADPAQSRYLSRVRAGSPADYKVKVGSFVVTAFARAFSLLGRGPSVGVGILPPAAM